MHSEGYSSWSVCLSVCLSVSLSVTTLVKASLGSMLRGRYVQHWYRLFSAFDSWIFENNLLFKSYAMSICLPRPPMALMQRYFA